VLFGAKNNADNGLFDTFANTFGNGEQQVISGGIADERTNYVTSKEFNAFANTISEFCKCQTQTNSLMEKAITALCDFVVVQKQTLREPNAKASNDSLAESVKNSTTAIQTNKQLYNFSEAAEMLGYYNVKSFTRMLIENGIVINRFHRYYVTKKYASKEFFRDRITPNGNHSSLHVTARGIKFLKAFVDDMRVKELELAF
jgi:hypothetical protein